jgi:hypothetical protein
MPPGCAGAFHGNLGRIQMLAGLTPFDQTVGTLLKNPSKVGQNHLENVLQWKKELG